MALIAPSVLGLTSVQMFFVMILLVCTVDGTDEREIVYYIDDGCQSDVKAKRVTYVHKSLQHEFGVRVCQLDGSSCITIGSCVTDFTRDIDINLCKQKEVRMCSKDMILSDVCIPTPSPTNLPTAWPTPPTPTPTELPTLPPTPTPTDLPTLPPTPTPTDLPTLPPTRTPTDLPTLPPSPTPTDLPTLPPTPTPTDLPTLPPTPTPTDLPTAPPTPTPTDLPTTPPTPGCIEKREWTKEIADEITRTKCPSSYTKRIFFGVKACKPSYQKRLDVSMANKLFGKCKDICVYDYNSIITGSTGAFEYKVKDKCYKYYSKTKYTCFRKKYRKVYSQVVELAKKFCPPTTTPSPTPSPVTPCIEKRAWTKEVARENCPSESSKIFGIEACNPADQKGLDFSLANKLFAKCDSKCVYNYYAFTSGRNGAFVYSKRNKCYTYTEEGSCFTKRSRKTQYLKVQQYANKFC